MNFILTLTSILSLGYIILQLYLIFNMTKCSRQKIASLYLISCIIACVVLVVSLSFGFIFCSIIWGLMLAMNAYRYYDCAKD